MKIVFASDSYKGCLSSAQVALYGERAVLDRLPDAQVVKVSVADGGEGTVESVVSALGGRIVSAAVSDPLGRMISADYGIAGNLAIIEVAAACGLPLLEKEELDPLHASTRGVGELILDAVSRGCTDFLIGLGGSATNDGGRGMVELDGFLEKTKGCRFTVACDVTTPFYGPDGASRVFGPQKGATPAMVEILDASLRECASFILSKTGIDVNSIPGSGAAGGLGGAFAAWTGATLKPGVDLVFETIRFDTLIKGADLVITGEGRSDFQTPKGKTPAGVLSYARRQNIPVVLMSGAILPARELDEAGFLMMMAVTPEGMPLEQALKPEIAAENIYRGVLKILDSTGLTIRKQNPERP